MQMTGRNLFDRKPAGGWWLRQADRSTALQSPSVYYLTPIKPSATQLHRHFLPVKDTRVLLDKINCRE